MDFREAHPLLRQRLLSMALVAAQKGIVQSGDDGIFADHRLFMANHTMVS